MLYKTCFIKFVLRCEQSLGEKKFCKSTKNSEKHAIGVFADYIRQARNVDVDINDYIKSLDIDDIDLLLRNFFATLRKSDSENLKITSFQAIRYGINRHFRTNCDIHIITSQIYKNPTI